MVIGLDVKVTEFEAGYSLHESPVYRIALGELIPANQRKTERVNFDNSQSGSVGFMDVARLNRAIPAKNERGHEIKDVLAVLVIGIEPEFRGKLRYFRYFIERVESLTREWRLDTIVADCIRNPKLRIVIERFGYETYYGGELGIRRL